MTINEQLTTITAAEFVAGGYAEKIKRGECDVLWLINDPSPLSYIRPMSVSPSEYEVHFKNDTTFAVVWAARSFVVTWLTPPPAETAPTGEAVDLNPIRGRNREIERLETQVSILQTELNAAIDEIVVKSERLETEETENRNLWEALKPVAQVWNNWLYDRSIKSVEKTLLFSQWLINTYDVGQIGHVFKQAAAETPATGSDSDDVTMYSGDAQLVLVQHGKDLTLLNFRISKRLDNMAHYDTFTGHGQNVTVTITQQATAAARPAADGEESEVKP